VRGRIPFAAAIVLAGAPWAALPAHGTAHAGALARPAVLAAALPLAAPPRAFVEFPRAQSSPDSALDRFLGSMSDSTAAYFGVTAARVDTAGLDSALAWGLVHPGALDRRRLRLSFGPWFDFSRVDGPVYGATAGFGRASGLGRIEGRIAWASGPNDVLGGGTLRRSLQRGNAAWSLQLYGGRRTDGMDADYNDIRLSMLRAFFSGTDYKHYLRRDGFEARLARETESTRLSGGYRDMLESPMATVATWSLTGSEPDVIGNLPATLGRNREFSAAAAARVPWLPAWAEAEYRSSSNATASDFEYRRTRLGLAFDFAAGRTFALVPQFTYGRLTGDAIPQASFYLGGSNTMRGILGATRGGTGLALARVDLIESEDILALARIPHPAWLPLQVSGFASAGAVWGEDPAGGPPRGGLDWPDEEHWVSEAGAALLWRPGLPDPAGFFKLSYAWPLGPAREAARWTASYSRALAFVKPFGE
jgi:hypothetical protein